MNTLFFKMAWRNLKRYKFNTIINTGGLVLGFIIGLAVLGMVYYMLQFNKFHQHRDRLFQVYNIYHHAAGDKINDGWGYPAGPAFQQNIGAIASMSRYLHGPSNARYNNHEVNINVVLVDSGFASMFSFPAKAGNLQSSLNQMNGLAITETLAKKIFGNEPAMGKTIQLSDGENLKEHVVTAVLEDVPNQSSLQFSALARIENESSYASNKDIWDNQNHQLFVMLKPNTSQATAEAQLRSFNHQARAQAFEGLKKEKAVKDKNGDEFATLLMPVTEMHFNKTLNSRGTSYSELAIIAAIGLVIILIACFNFININLAQAFLRSREIGVRKCLGAGQSSLISQLWVESFLVCVIAFVLAIAGVYVLIDQLQENGLLPQHMGRGLVNLPFAAISIGLLVFVSLLAGGYPSWIMARFQVVDSLKGKINRSGNHALRNTLMVVQFVIAAVMISCTMVIYNQFQYLQAADIGIDRSHVISVPIMNPKKGKDIVAKIRQRLASEPGVLSVSGSDINIGRGRDGSVSRSKVGFDYHDRQIMTDMVHADYDYAKTLGIKIVDGRDFDQSFGKDSNYTVLISEAVAKQFGPDAVVGASLRIDSSGPRWNVAGVFKGFHLYGMREEAEPLTIVLESGTDMSYVLVKTNEQRAKQTMAALENAMKQLEPDAEFQGSFIEENIQKWYVQEKTMSQLFSVAAILAIVLSCTGLLAMVMQVTRQRVKEIGIRKVLGAGVWQISWLVSVSFLKLVGIAILIALPVSWMMMNSWLQKFPFRIHLTIWDFLLVALIAITIAAITIAYNTLKAATQNPAKSIRTD